MNVLVLFIVFVFSISIQTSINLLIGFMEGIE